MHAGQCASKSPTFLNNNAKLRAESSEFSDSILDQAVMKTAVSIGYKLLKSEVILLATAHDLFCLHMSEIDSGIDSSAGKELITARCLLGQLSSHLQHHMMYTCKVRKYGTLVYGPNTDFIQAISRLLWEHKKTQCHRAP